MIAGKTFKKMDSDEMLSILEAADISGDDQKLACVIEDLPELYFLKQVQAGQMRVNDISFQMRPLYRIFWQFQAAGKNLHVCASLALSPEGDPSVWGNGVERLARMNGCGAITFSTGRKGHVADARKWGAEITGVTMKKVL
jgi:hypothetical protein